MGHKNIITLLSFILLNAGWAAAGEPAPDLGQNWKPGWEVGESQWFHHASQGTMMIPYDWFMSLEQPTTDPAMPTTPLFSDAKFLARFGFLPSQRYPKYNPDQLPVGFAIHENWRDPNDANARPIRALGLTCAACHTGEITYRKTKLRIEGGSAMINLGAFQKAMALSLFITNSCDRKFQAFAARWLKRQKLPKGFTAAAAKQLLKTALEQAVARIMREQKVESDLNLHTVDAGFSRTDALARIGNKVFGRLSTVNLSETDAPVNFPHLWNTSWFYWVQYNASIRLPMVRNIGEALGVGAAVNATRADLSTFESTVDVRNLYLMEEQLSGKEPFEGLRAPVWPEKLLGEIEGFRQKTGKWKHGKQLYEKHCIHCHYRAEDYQATLHLGASNEEHNRHWTNPNQFGRMFMKLPYINFVDIGTDPAAAVKFHRRIVYVGSLPGSNKRGTMSAVDALTFVTGKVRERAFAKLGLSPAEHAAFDGYRELGREEGVVARLAYKARPLDGIWATAPYLHNGSVANLYEMLLPADQRMKSFYLGSTEFDPKHVGFDFKARPGAFRMDTTEEGNLNTGHEFRNFTEQEKKQLTAYQKARLGERKGWSVNGVVGPELTDKERWALIEYLKSLGSPQQAQEVPPRGEADAIQKLGRIQSSIQRNIVGKGKRGQHFKGHGTVEAKFQVADKLPPRLKVGLFREPKSYRALVRFSNGDGVNDKNPDVHGMAVKVFLDGDTTPHQDFILADNPVFFAKNPDHLVQFLGMKMAGADVSAILQRFPQLATFKKTMASPLETTYWSQTPYRFGDLGVKYSAMPSKKNGKSETAAEPHAFRKTMVKRLTPGKNGPAIFDFNIHEQTDVRNMPIEDPTIAWNSAPIKLATITIEPQSFDTKEQNERGENLSYNVWNALPEHRPLGGINRARKGIYEASKRLRHATNNVQSD